MKKRNKRLYEVEVRREYRDWWRGEATSPEEAKLLACKWLSGVVSFHNIREITVGDGEQTEPKKKA